MATYKKLWVSDDYKAGIYDRCNAIIYIREDGLRARIEMDMVRWTGNTGGYYRAKEYIKGRSNVKALVKKLRRSQVEALIIGMGRHNRCVLDRVIGAY